VSAAEQTDTSEPLCAASSEVGLTPTLNHNRPMLSRAAAFLIWALVAATGVFWLLRLTAEGPSVRHASVASPQTLPARAELSRVLGSTPVMATPAAASPELSSRFVLTGVMAPKKSSGGAGRSQGPGLALIAVDGQPAKPYALGAKLDGNLTLLAVTLRSASIGPEGGAPVLILELPALPPPATGVLPTLSVTRSSPVAAPPPVQPPPQGDGSASPNSAPTVMQRAQ
jgi:general secretion pathway protein C